MLHLLSALKPCEYPIHNPETLDSATDTLISGYRCVSVTHHCNEHVALPAEHCVVWLLRVQLRPALVDDVEFCGIRHLPGSCSFFIFWPTRIQINKRTVESLQNNFYQTAGLSSFKLIDKTV